jgi:hypothetical protein
VEILLVWSNAAIPNLFGDFKIYFFGVYFPVWIIETELALSVFGF